MSLITNLSRLSACPSSYLRRCKRRAISAVEFALTLPIWIALLIGTTDGAYMMLLAQRVDRISYTVTDIVTQQEAVTIADLNTIMLAAGQLMQPFDFGADGIVIVTSIYKPAGQPTKICWQHIGGGSLARVSKIGTVGATPQMPGGLTLNDNENIIVSEVYYAYRPMFINAGIFTADDIYRVAIYKPRLNSLIAVPT